MALLWVYQTVLPPCAEDLSAWAFPSSLSSHSQRLTAVGEWEPSSISVSKEPDLATEWLNELWDFMHIQITSWKFFNNKKISTTFLLVLSQTLMDLLFTTWIYGKINYPGHCRKDSVSKVISQTITIKHWKKEMTASVPMNHAELHFFEWMSWIKKHHYFENNSITKIK